MTAPRVVAITDRPDSPHGWWRIKQPFIQLKHNGFDVDWCWLDSDDKPQVSIDNSIVVLQRTIVKGDQEYAKAWIASLREQGAIKIVYELDDDVLSKAFINYLNDCPSITRAAIHTSELQRHKTIELMKMCDAVTVSTNNLKNVVNSFCSLPVYVLPNMIDVEWYLNAVVNGSLIEDEEQTNDTILVGWSGGLRPFSELEDMAEAWRIVADKYPQVRFVNGGWQANIIYELVPYEKILRRPWVDWNDWPRNMKVDIGCCPMEYTPFNICKSPIKVMEYGLSGAAVVASPIVYNTIINGVTNGYMVSDVSGWVNAISKLIDNPMVRKAQNQHLKRDIIRGFDLEINYINWMMAYQDIQDEQTW